MHRMTPLQGGFRGHAGGGKRVTVDEANDGETMQSMKGTAMHGESRKDIESPQNYGFTSVVAKADKDDKGNITGSAEGFMSAMGGSSSHAIVAVMDDRRHRLKDLKPGDSGMYRGKDDRQQFHLAGDGNYMSARNDRKQRFALVPPPDDDKKQQGGRSPTATTAAASGGSSGGSGGSDAKGKDDKKPKGQKPALDDNKKSEVAIEQNGKETFSQHGKFYSSVRGGSDSSHYYEDRKKSSQATEEHVHMRYKDFKIWVDKDGHWSELPILQKKDLHCKE
jgi:phage gp45-like